MINCFAHFLAKRARNLDLKILWPACVAKSPNLEHAKAAFKIHAFNDSSWLILPPGKIHEIIDALEEV